MDWDEPLHKEFIIFVKSFITYLAFRFHKSGLHFESIKDFIVDLLMVRRGANTSLFVHIGVLALALSVLLGGGIILSSSVVSGSYPGVPANPLLASFSSEGEETGVI